MEKKRSDRSLLIQPLRVEADRLAHREEARAVGVEDLVEFRVVYTRDVALHVGLAGPADGEPVVMLHGFPDLWMGWSEQIRPLVEAGYRVILPDQRGYNRSEKPAGVRAYRLESLGRDILDLLEALEYEEAHLVGHDWGGAVAWWLAEHHPGKWKTVSVLNCPPADVMARALQREFRQFKKSWYILLFQLPRLPEKVASAGKFRFLEEALRRGSTAGAFSHWEIDLYKEAWKRPGALTGMMNWYRAARSGLFERRKPEPIRVPAQIIWGKKDLALDPLLVEPSAARCTDVQVHWVEQAGHWVQRDAAELVTEKLLQHFHEDIISLARH